MTDSETDIVVGTRRLAERLGVSDRWVRQQVRARTIPHVRAGRQPVFSVEAVTNWMRRTIERVEADSKETP